MYNFSSPASSPLLAVQVRRTKPAEVGEPRIAFNKFCTQIRHRVQEARGEPWAPSSDPATVLAPYFFASVLRF